LPTRSAIHITALQPTSATTTTTHKLRRGPEIGPWARKPHDPNRYQAEDDIPSEPVVGRFAGLAVNEAAEPSAGQTSDVRAEVDDHRKDGAYLDDRGECGDAGIIDLQPEKSLRDGQMAGTRHREELGDAFDDAKQQGFDQIHGRPRELEREHPLRSLECPECDQS
jgi:hypothetical protein